MGMVISVIIPALNEERLIGGCLEALAAQTGPGAFEVLVVDNGSKDGTAQTAAGFTRRLAVRVLKIPGGSIAAARNHGAAEARGQILAFLDADCLARPDWLMQVETCMADDTIGIAGAPYLPPPGANWLARAWAGHEQRNTNGEVDFVPGGTLILRRRNFSAWRGFDPTLTTSEDVEFCSRVRALGGRVVARPELAVRHLGTPSTLTGFFRKQLWHGQDVARVFRLSLPRLVNARAVGFALWTLLFTGVTAAGLAWGLTGRTGWLLLTGLAGLAAPPLALGVRSVAPRRAWADLPALWILFLVYGLARAAAFFMSPPPPGSTLDPHRHCGTMNPRP